MPSPPGLADLLADLAEAFARLQVPWYVFGAQAALGQSDLIPQFEAELARRPLARRIDDPAGK